MRERYVGAELQPVGNLSVNGSAARITLERRHDHVRGVVEEVARHVVVHLVVTAADAERVLLTELLGEEVVVVVVGIEQLCIGVQTAGLEIDQGLALGKFVCHVVAQYIEEVVVCTSCSIGMGIAICRKVVVQTSVCPLVVVAGVLHGLVLADTHLVPAPLGLEGDVSLLVAGALLRGDEDDTVRSTRSVEGVCSGILRNDYRLDVERVDRRQSRRVRHTVDNDKGSLITVDRTDTADVYRGVGTRLTRRAV